MKPRDRQPPQPPKEKPVTYKVPEIAASAFNLAMQNFQLSVNQLGVQAVKSLGLDPEEYDYSCNFDTGVITRGKKVEKE